MTNWVRDRFVYGGRAGGGKTIDEPAWARDYVPQLDDVDKALLEQMGERLFRNRIMEELGWIEGHIEQGMRTKLPKVSWRSLAQPRRRFEGLLWWLGFGR
jgi:hypothetical protein